MKARGLCDLHNDRQQPLKAYLLLFLYSAGGRHSCRRAGLPKVTKLIAVRAGWDMPDGYIYTEEESTALLS
jgi:hypothetical protein